MRTGRWYVVRSRLLLATLVFGGVACSDEAQAQSRLSAELAEPVRLEAAGLSCA
jgi:hypothetical protein